MIVSSYLAVFLLSKFPEPSYESHYICSIVWHVPVSMSTTNVHLFSLRKIVILIEEK